MTRARIEVPATSANLGPGFDTFGLALELCNTVRVELTPDRDEVVLVETTGAENHALDPHDNLLCVGYLAWAQDSGTTLPGARFTIESRIPIGFGLGSSAAAIVAGLAAAAFAAEEKRSRDRILRLASQIEGHPDNAVAAVLGGMTVAFMQDGETHALQVVSHMNLGVGLFLPDDELLTAEARAALPSKVPLRDAVFNVARAAYFATALAWGKWELMGAAMEDRLHQPYRSRLIPALEPVLQSAREAGAYGAALSGGGPAVIAFGPAEAVQEFTAAMEGAARDRGWPGKGLVTSVRQHGVQIHKED